MRAPKNEISAGDALRQLRQRQGLKQSDLELDGIITQANYSRLENGLSTPSKGKLEAILDQLHPSFNERQSILTSCGYVPPIPLPTDPEIDATRELCQPILDELPIPAYLVDILTRLVSWNDLFAKLLGEERALAEQLRGTSLFKAQFAGHYDLSSVIEDMEVHLLDDARMIRERLAPYTSEKWYSDFIEELCEEPGFRDYWDASADLEPPEPKPVAFAARILHPVEFALSDMAETTVQFYSNPEELVDDSRFQMIYLIPMDAFTMRQVERWRGELAE